MGKLGVGTLSNVGFDIYSSVSGGRVTSNTAFASLGPGRFYSVSLADGQVSLCGSFTTGVHDIAVPLDQD